MWKVGTVLRPSPGGTPQPRAFCGGPPPHAPARHGTLPSPTPPPPPQRATAATTAAAAAVDGKRPPPRTRPSWKARRGRVACPRQRLPRVDNENPIQAGAATLAASAAAAGSVPPARRGHRHTTPIGRRPPPPHLPQCAATASARGSARVMSVRRVSPPPHCLPASPPPLTAATGGERPPRGWGGGGDAAAAWGKPAPPRRRPGGLKAVVNSREPVGRLSVTAAAAAAPAWVGTASRPGRRCRHPTSPHGATAWRLRRPPPPAGARGGGRLSHQERYPHTCDGATGRRTTA